MDNNRRIFLRAGMASAAAGMAVAAGLLTPRMVLAAWPKQAFEATKVDDAIKAVYGSTALEPSDKVTVKTPDIAENGAVVSITVRQKLPGAQSISILVPENGSKLAASYELSKQCSSFITCRIKMRKTSDVIAVVKAGDKLYSAKGRVKVTLGGCGG